MNWLDILLAALLLQAAVRGFIKGFWVSFLSFGGTIAGLIGAYCLTGPAVRFLESRWQLVTRLEDALFGSVASLPVSTAPFGPSSIANISDFVSRYPSVRILATAAEKALVETLSTRQVATVGQALAVLFSALLVRTVVFVLLVLGIRGIAMLLARGLDIVTYGSVVLRLMGACLETLIRTLWLAVLVGGILYPLAVTGTIPVLKSALETSRLTPPLLVAYRTIAAVAFGWLRP